MNRSKYAADKNTKAFKPKVGCNRCGSKEHDLCSLNDRGDGLFVIGKPVFVGRDIRTELGVIPLDEWNAGRRDFPVLPR